MMVRFLLLPLLSLILLASTGLADGKTYGGRDGSIKLRDTCGMPVIDGAGQSVNMGLSRGGDWFLEFRLAPGDVGQCAGDDAARHSAPYWERAELSQVGRMTKRRVYHISFGVALNGFSGDRESFFQIHAWRKGCAAYPPVMMMFDNGKLVIRALRRVKQNKLGLGRKGSHKKYRVSGITPEDFRSPRRLEVTFDRRRDPAQLRVALDGQVILNPVPVEIAACGEPYVKLGIYRPGKGLAVSRAYFDDISFRTSN